MSEPTAPDEPRSTSPSLVRIAFSGAAWLSAMNGLAGIVMIGLVAWLNRTLVDAPVSMGTWGTVGALVLMTSLMLDGGIPLAIMQRTEIHRGALAALIWLQLILGLAGSAALYFFATPLARLWSEFPQDDLSAAFRLAAPAVFFIALGMPPKAILQKDLRFRLVALIESGSTIVLIVIAFALARTRGVEGLVIALLARHGCETLLYWALGSLRPADLFVRFDIPAVAERLRFGVSMGLQSILGTAMRQGDRLLVGMLAGPVASGLYQQIQTVVVQPFAKLAVYVARAAFPTFAKAKDEPERLLRGLARMQRMLAICIFPMLAGMAAVAPRMLLVLLGDGYAEHLPVAVASFQILCAGTLLFNYGYASGVALNAIGLSRRMLTRQAIGGAAVAIFIVAGSPWGLFGASIGRALASAVIAFLFLDLARRAMSFSAALVRESVREALPASLACLVVAIGVGLLGDRLLPTSHPYMTAEAGRTAVATATVLACQVGAGAAAYVSALALLGVKPVAEIRSLFGRGPGIA